MYLRYEFIYLFLSLLGYPAAVKRFLLRGKSLVPASAFANKALVVLNAMKNGDTKLFYTVKTLFFKRNVP